MNNALDAFCLFTLSTFINNAFIIIAFLSVSLITFWPVLCGNICHFLWLTPHPFVTVCTFFFLKTWLMLKKLRKLNNKNQTFYWEVRCHILQQCVLWRYHRSHPLFLAHECLSPQHCTLPKETKMLGHFLLHILSNIDMSCYFKITRQAQALFPFSKVHNVPWGRYFFKRIDVYG